jgi:tight adherence protein B
MAFTTILLIGGAVVVVALVIGAIITATSQRSNLEERLGKYLEDETGEGKKKEASALGDWVNKSVEKTSFGDKISRDLARADMKFKPGEFVALIVIATISLAAVAFLIGGHNLISALIGGVLGAALPRMYLRSQQNKRLIKFNDQLPDMINLMVNGLRAGYSTLQAMEAVSKELPAPICDEFRRVVQEMQLGIPMEKSLSNMLRRINSDDLDFLITAVNVQREVGGNLAEILDIISYTIRERIRIKGEIRVLTSQVMFSGRLLSLLPVGLICLLWFLNRSYIMEFFAPGNAVCGGIALGVAAVMIVIGYFVMTRIAKIEV